MRFWLENLLAVGGTGSRTSVGPDLASKGLPSPLLERAAWGTTCDSSLQQRLSRDSPAGVLGKGDYKPRAGGGSVWLGPVWDEADRGNVELA